MSEAQAEIEQGWQRTHPLAMVAGAIAALKNAIFPIIAVMFGSQAMDRGSGFLFLIVLAIIGINLLAAWLGWLRLRYRVGADDIRVEKGLVSRSARSVPYERIQDVSLEQKPIPRLLGLTEVRFETGAGGKDELRLAYVTLEEGERLREVVRDLRDEAQGLELAEKKQREEQGELLFHMGPERLLKFGMFEFSLVAIAVIGGAAQQFDFLLPFDLWDPEGWEERLAGPGDWLAGLGWASRIVGAIIAFIALVGIGFVTGIARTFLRDWDFRLDRTLKGFRRRRGLLTKTDVVMPVHRVQATVVDTGILRRIFGWHGLSFISLAQDAKSANHSVAPFAQMDEIAPILEVAKFDLPAADTKWHRASADYYLVRALFGAVPFTIGGMVALVFAPSVWIGFGLIGVAGFIALRAHYLWRYERHAVDARQIMSRRGWLSPKLKLADRVKLHSVEISQGPLAKWCGYADLKFGLAGGTLSFGGLPLAEAQEMRAAVLSSIASVDFSRLPR